LLKATFKGTSGGDEQLIGGTVYWYMPQTATLLDVFPAELSTYSTDKIIIYTDEDAFNIDYERGRLFEKAINVVGPDDNNKYKQYTISSDYSGAEKRTGTKTEFENDYSDLDTNKTYVIKDTDGKYYKYQNSEGTWTSTEIIKFVCGTPLSLEEIKANSLISKSGYTCYYRTITEANLESALQFPYHIKSYY
jgi:hypothetical protein